MSTAHTPSPRIPRDVRRQHILDCATRLFSDKGFMDTTMDDVAAAAHITKRTLYRYVKTKEELLFDIHEEFAGTTLINGQEDLPRDPVERFNELIGRHVETVTSQTKEIAVFFDERKHLSPVQERFVHRSRHRYEMLMVDTIAAAQSQGAFVEIDTPVAARAVLGSLTEIYRWYEPDGRLSAAKISSVAQEVFTHGIAVAAMGQEELDNAVLKGVRHRKPPVTPTDPADMVRSAAIKSFASVGYRASSIRELAELANVTKGAVMYHAQYKQNLLTEIIETVMSDGTDVLMASRALGGDSVTKLARLLATLILFQADRADEIAVANENLNYLQPAARRKILALRTKWTNVVEDALEEGVAEGVFNIPDLFVTRQIIVGMLNSTYRWLRPSGRLKPEELARIYAQIVLMGLEGRD